MPTKLKRYSVSFPDDILPLLMADCQMTKMKVGTQILAILVEHYQMRISQPMMFGRSQPIAKESKHARPLVFRAAPRREELPVSDRRVTPGQK